MDLAAQRLCHALSPALWGFPAVASNERSGDNDTSSNAKSHPQ